MRRLAIDLTLFAASFATDPVASAQAAQVPAQDAHDVAVNAYLYFYPLITMDLTRLQSTNVAAGKEIGKGPMNTFANIPEYPPANFKTVVRPNFDTLYSSGWLDLIGGPVIVSVPDTNGRYYLFPMLDMWSDVFASPGWRTTGTQAGNFAVTPPGWSGALPDGVTLINAPTPYVWIIGRTKTDGPADYNAVRAIQAGYKMTPLAAWGKAPAPVSVTVDPNVDMTRPPKQQVDTMSGDKYFTYAAELLKRQPPHVTDEPIVAQLNRLGFVAGHSLNFNALDPSVKQAFMQAPADAQKLMQTYLPKMAPVFNGWQMNVNTMGVYGNFYLKRALVAQVGLGANLPEDAIYPINLADNTGKPLDGTNRYKIHFAKGALPPAQAFWSITLYDADGFQVANALNRFAISSWMPLKTNDDGSLDLYFQHDTPGAGMETNWLPAPGGAFNLTMRLYAPGATALDGSWNPPVVARI
ncbi:MAG: DUF1254 domain-containing protein [Candidatus Tumulicola sp.]